jgi:hypothetical protein
MQENEIFYVVLLTFQKLIGSKSYFDLCWVKVHGEGTVTREMEFLS